MNQRIVLFCDNQAVVSMINNNTSSCKNCLVLIRMLVLHSMKLNTRVFARYVSSRANKNADLLSRLKVQEFKRRNQGCDVNMTAIPQDLVAGIKAVASLSSTLMTYVAIFRETN